VLDTLIGYSDEPSVLQVVAYVTTLAVIVVLTKAFGAGQGREPPPGVDAFGCLRSLRANKTVGSRSGGSRPFTPNGGTKLSHEGALLYGIRQG
jgi:hypothetical protein